MFEASWSYLAVGCAISVVSLFLTALLAEYDDVLEGGGCFLLVIQFLAPIVGCIITFSQIDASTTISNMFHASLVATIFSFGIWLIILFEEGDGATGLVIFTVIFGILITIAFIFCKFQVESNPENKPMHLEESYTQNVVEDVYLCDGFLYTPELVEENGKVTMVFEELEEGNPFVRITKTYNHITDYRSGEPIERVELIETKYQYYLLMLPELT